MCTLCIYMYHYLIRGAHAGIFGLAQHFAYRVDYRGQAVGKWYEMRGRLTLSKLFTSQLKADSCALVTFRSSLQETFYTECWLLSNRLQKYKCCMLIQCMCSVCWYGSDWCVVCPQAGLSDSSLIAEIQQLQKTHAPNTELVPVTVS